MTRSRSALRLLALGTAAVLGQFTLTSAPAQTAASPAAKPSNATGQCKDGTYSTASSKSGACRGHNGVKDWYTASAPSPAAPAPPASAAKAAPTAPSSPQPAAKSAPAPAPTAPPASTSNTQQPATTSRKGPKANLAATPAAPGGGPGLVWVNTASNVYHCPNTDFYGKTKAGAYMSEADAKAKGARPDHGNACSK